MYNKSGKTTEKNVLKGLKKYPYHFIHYSVSEDVFSEGLAIFSKYPIDYKGICQFSKGYYMDRCIEIAKSNGWVETLLHRKRYLPDINSHNANVRGFAERNAVNAPIQGTAADIIKIAMVNISRRFHEEQLRSKMILQVHVFPSAATRDGETGTALAGHRGYYLHFYRSHHAVYPAEGAHRF